ncbi:hypothetical protein Tfer_2784 [Thermincola ferriacetica]|uniref:YcfA family protein n=1 Tax=Thermincola ferriacetica TaxID=281456 RepID=A0A0L6VZJ5_9FIRM|nr:hypothetical protein [Thermincola ferriacetica]KNZ68690.1 hypothetical protein Tfer_2784 [Thermincola ferriacetica]
MRIVRPRKDVETALENKGFRKNNNDHRKFVYYSLSGKKTSIWTKTSHGTSHKDISLDNLKKMAKQCRLTLQDFCDLLDCPLSREEYEQRMVSGGYIMLKQI